MFITISVSHSCGIWFLSIILLNSSSNCILNLFPSNFHISIGRLPHPQLFLCFAFLSTSFSSSIVIMSLLSSVPSLLLSSFVPSAPLLPCSFQSFPYYSFHSVFGIGSILSLSLSCSCSCLNILKPRLCVPVMSFQCLNKFVPIISSLPSCHFPYYCPKSFIFYIVFHCFVL